MKKILVVLFAVMLVSLSASAFAAQKMGKGAKEVSAYASISSTDSSVSGGGTTKSNDQTLSLGLGYFLTDPISVGVRIDEMMSKQAGSKFGTTFVEVEGKFHFYMKGQPVIPYAGLSLGAAMTEVAGESSTGALFQPKAGVKVFLTENVAANAELNYSIYESSIAGVDITNKTLKFQAGLSMFF